MNASTKVTTARTASALLRLQPTSISSTSAVDWPSSFFFGLHARLADDGLAVSVNTTLARYTTKRIAETSRER